MDMQEESQAPSLSLIMGLRVEFRQSIRQVLLWRINWIPTEVGELRDLGIELALWIKLTNLEAPGP